MIEIRNQSMRPQPPIAWTPAEAAIFRRRPDLKVSQYAERHRIVASGELRGQWRNENAPYLVKP